MIQHLLVKGTGSGRTPNALQHDIRANMHKNRGIHKTVLLLLFSPWTSNTLVVIKPKKRYTADLLIGVLGGPYQAKRPVDVGQQGSTLGIKTKSRVGRGGWGETGNMGHVFERLRDRVTRLDEYVKQQGSLIFSTGQE